MALRRLRVALAWVALAAAPAASAQVTVSITKTYAVETIYVADFAPYNVGQQPDFLAIRITNNAAGAQSVRLRLKIFQERPDNVLLFEGSTGSFRVTGTRIITNRDLSNQASDVVIDDFEIGENVDDLTDRVAQSGRFPSGTYAFQVQVTTPSGLVIGNAETRYELVNPSRLELLAPGRPFGEQPELVTTPAPTFLWSADEGLVGGIGSYKIRVVPAGAAASPEEAMQSFASWEGSTTATTAIYPGSVMAIPLVAGQTYAWQVTREVKTSGGAQLIASPIHWFKMSGGTEQQGGSSGGGAGVGTTLELQRLLQSLGFGADLGGFHPTGQIIVDGLPGSFENLEALIRAILSGQVSVRSVTVQ